MPPPTPISPAKKPLRFLASRAWPCVVVTAAAWLFAALWPPMLDSTSTTIGAISTVAFFIRTFELQLGLALAVALAFGLLTRRSHLSMLACVFAVAHLAPAAWSYRPRSIPIPASDSATLTVMSMNVMYGRAEAATVTELLDSVKPDVIFIQEYTPDSERTLAPLLATRYPFSSRYARDDAFGQAIFSNIEFAEPVRPFPPGFLDPQLHAKVKVGGRIINLLNVHVLPPISLQYALEQRSQVSSLATFVRALRAANPSEPIIVAGDLNCTPRGHHVQAMCDAGLTDAWKQVGHGRGHTWVAIGALQHLPGFRLDHILYSGPLNALAAGNGKPMGSDHLATWCRLEVPRPSR